MVNLVCTNQVHHFRPVPQQCSQAFSQFYTTTTTAVASSSGHSQILSHICGVKETFMLYTYQSTCFHCFVTSSYEYVLQLPPRDQSFRTGFRIARLSAAVHFDLIVQGTQPIVSTVKCKRQVSLKYQVTQQCNEGDFTEFKKLYNSVYQAPFSANMHKSLGSRLIYMVCHSTSKKILVVEMQMLSLSSTILL